MVVGECECEDTGYAWDLWWNQTGGGTNCDGCLTSWTYLVEDDNGAQTAIGNAHESADCGDDAGSRHNIKCPCTGTNWVAFQAGCTDCP